MVVAKIADDFDDFVAFGRVLDWEFAAVYAALAVVQVVVVVCGCRN